MRYRNVNNNPPLKVLDTTAMVIPANYKGPIPTTGRPILIKIGRRQAWCWLYGDQKDATLFYPNRQSGMHPGIADLMKAWAPETEIAVRQCILYTANVRWRYVRLNRIQRNRIELYSHVRAHGGIDTSERVSSLQRSQKFRRRNANYDHNP